MKHISPIACYALTTQGAALAQKLAKHIPLHIYVPERMAQDERGFTSLPVLVAQTFSAYTSHIFIGATGIATRCIAPHLRHKSKDPAIVVCDDAGHFAISLVSGHWGGANALAAQIAEYIGGQAVITTASDVNNTLAVDVLAQESGLRILDWERVKHINSAFLEGIRVQLFDPLRLFHALDDSIVQRVSLTQEDALPRLQTSTPAVCIDWRKVPEHEQVLRLAIPALHVGIGCKKHVTCEEICEALETTLAAAHLEPHALACLASVTHKKEEKGLLEAAQKLQLPLRLFSAEELAEAPTLTPSAMAAQIFGVEHISVCEGAALLAAGGDDATLLVPKMVHGERVTVSVAIAEHFLPESEDA